MNEEAYINKKYPFSGDNVPGLYVGRVRKEKNYTMEDISHGICSTSTLSRIEAGEKIVDYLMIELLLDRMKIQSSEFEFVLDNDSYRVYRERLDIKDAIKKREYKKAEEQIERYRRNYAQDRLHQQFLYYQMAQMERKRNRLENTEICELFHNAVQITAPDYRKFFQEKIILSNIELSCIMEIIACMDTRQKREEGYQELHNYFIWCEKRDGFFPEPYRTNLYYYAECLYERMEYEKCIEMCDDAVKELEKISKLENRSEVFLLRANAREKLGFAGNEDREICLRDFLTAYYVADSYENKKLAEAVRQHIGEVYGWQYIV